MVNVADANLAKSSPDFIPYLESQRRFVTMIKSASSVKVRGRVTELTGLVIKAAVPNVNLAGATGEELAKPMYKASRFAVRLVVIKGLLIGLQYRHKAGEGRIAD